MNRWLEGFAYRMNLGLWPFLMATGFVLIVAMGTVGYHSMKAGTANPVDSLRYE